MSQKRTTIPLFEIIRSANQALLRNWSRAVLTSLSMVVGTASLVLVVVVGISGRAYVLDLIKGVGTNLITIYHESDDVTRPNALADRLNQDDLKAIKTEIPGVHFAAPIILSAPTISMEGITSIVSLIGTVPEYQQVRNLEMLRGRFIDENDERSRSKVCVVTELLAQKLERDPFYRETVDLHGINFKVIGVFRERVDTMGQTEVTDHSAIIPLPVARYFKQSDKIDQIYVSADKLELVPEISESIQNLLTSRHSNRSLIKVQNLTKMLKAANLITLGLTVMLLVIASISLITSGIGIMNVMLITVTERTREIGVKKAIGALRRILLIEFLVEALILTCGGGIIGIVIGVAIPYSVHFYAPSLRIEIPPMAILLGFGVTLLVGVIFGMLPALKASRLNPVDALRYE